MFAVDQSRYIEQNKRKLEGSPLRLIQRIRIAACASDAAAGRQRDSTIHEAECRSRLGIGCKNIYAGCNSTLCGFHFSDQPLPPFPPSRLQPAAFAPFTLDPL